MKNYLQTPIYKELGKALKKKLNPEERKVVKELRERIRNNSHLIDRDIVEDGTLPEHFDEVSRVLYWGDTKEGFFWWNERDEKYNKIKTKYQL